jgi:hypothetical protein
MKTPLLLRRPAALGLIAFVAFAGVGLFGSSTSLGGERVAHAGPLDEQQLGSLTVDTNPPAELSINGQVVGMTPMTVPLKPGKHHFSVKAANGKQVGWDVELKAGEKKTIRISLG